MQTRFRMPSLCERPIETLDPAATLGCRVVRMRSDVRAKTAQIASNPVRLRKMNRITTGEM
jgi:hypothetical protein